MMTKLNPSTAQSFALGLTLRAAIARTDVTLSVLAAAYGRESIITLINAWLWELCEYINVKPEMKLSESQMHQTAMLLYSEAYFLNVAEFSLFFVRMKKGRYDKFYGAIDGQSIMVMLGEYLSDRRVAVDALRKEQEQERREAEREKAKLISAAIRKAIEE